MIIYFSIYSFLGFCMESLYVSLLQKRWIASGLLKGPFIPIYGIGACCLIMIAPYIHNNPFLACILGGCSMTIIEYLGSLFIEKIFHTKCWDYQNHFLHFQGRIYLLYFMMWCFLSYLFVFYIHPFIASLQPINDIACMMSLIYMIFILRAFINRYQFERKNGLDIQ